MDIYHYRIALSFLLFRLFNAFSKGILRKRPLVEFFVRKEIRIIRIISPEIEVLLIRGINFIFGKIILIILISFRSCVAARGRFFIEFSVKTRVKYPQNSREIHQHVLRLIHAKYGAFRRFLESPDNQILACERIS